MKARWAMNRALLLHCFFTCLLLGSGCAASEKLPDADGFAFGWQFHYGDIELQKADASTWREVQIPHDWSIESPPGESPFSADSEDAYDTGYARAGVGWYRKSFYVPEFLSGKRLLVEFGGIYLNSEIYLNGVRVGGQHNGYMSFAVELTPEIRFGGRNTLAVRVDNNGRNSRWYSGSGIYRPVALLVRNPVDFQHWGTRVVTSRRGDAARIAVNTGLDVRAPGPVRATLRYRVIDASGKIVARAERKLTLDAGEQRVQQDIPLARANLWSPASPYRYRLQQELAYGENSSSSEISFGVRELRFDSETGFSINGEPTLLRGMNLHHDNYMLGAAAYGRAEERKVERILAAGYNAVRTSHNPPSRAFLDAADRLGLLVIDEAFDAWNRRKWDHDNDYSSHFKRDWRRDLGNFIARDFNHPSVILWSLGNEIPEQNEPLGADTAKALVDFVHALDSSRPTTIGANTSGKKADPFLNSFDVVGYNYEKDHYLSDRKRNPRRIMYGSETYPRDAFEYWSTVEKYPFVIGDFVWTGWDYLGDAGIGWSGYGPDWQGIGSYPWQLAFCGEIDALGYKRPLGYYRDVLWQTGKNRLSLFVQSPEPSYRDAATPERYDFWVHPDIHPSWTWPGHEQQPLDVRIYSVYDRVQLFLNGRSLGVRDNAQGNKWQRHFTVNYQPGELVAVGYRQVDGEYIPAERRVLATTSGAAAIELTADRGQFSADGRDLVYLTAQLRDKNGRPVYLRDLDRKLSFEVSGPADLIGIGNGNPVSRESFQDLSHSTHHGRLVAVVRSRRKQPGEITVRVSSGNGMEAFVRLVSH